MNHYLLIKRPIESLTFYLNKFPDGANFINSMQADRYFLFSFEASLYIYLKNYLHLKHSGSHCDLVLCGVRQSSVEDSETTDSRKHAVRRRKRLASSSSLIHRLHAQLRRRDSCLFEEILREHNSVWRSIPFDIFGRKKYFFLDLKILILFLSLSLSTSFKCFCRTLDFARVAWKAI